MKRIGKIAAVFAFAAVFAVSAFAQTGAQAGGKIGWINTAAFADEKEGITRYVNAEKALDAEMKPRALELQTLRTKIEAIAADLQKMTSNPAVPVDQRAAAAKQDEGEKLKREYEFKQKEGQAAFAKRRGEVLAPVSETIFTALQEYAKNNGYSVVLDIATLGSENAPSPILVLDQSANITKGFITYYNARPATTATTTPRQ